MISSNPIKEFAEVINSMKKVIGEATGRYTQRLIIIEGESVKVDIFIPQASDYFRQLVIRTGSRDYVHYVIADKWSRMGWCGTEDGLRRRSECEKTGNTWKCTAIPPSELPPVWSSEAEFFSWLDIEYVEPKLRDYAMSNPRV